MKKEKKAAKQTLKVIDKYYIVKHEYRQVDPKEFTHLNLRFYDKVMKQLQKKGFSHLIDEEILTLKGGPSDMRTFIRVALSEDGCIMAALYHPKPKFWIRLLSWLSWQKFGKGIDLETEFSDGSFLVTSNVKAAGDMESPPTVFAEYFPWRTSLRKLLKRHRQKIADYQEKMPDIKPIILINIEDIHQSQERLNKVRAEFRKQISGIAKSDLQELASEDQELAESVSYEDITVQDHTKMAAPDENKAPTSVEEQAQPTKQEKQKPRKKPVESQIPSAQELLKQEKTVPPTAKTQTPPAQVPPRKETPAPTKAEAEKQYRIVFYGEIVPGQQLEDVKKRVAALYKAPVDQCERLFTEQRKTIKKNIDYQTAKKYKRAFERTGAICQIEEIKEKDG